MLTPPDGEPENHGFIRFGNGSIPSGFEAEAVGAKPVSTTMTAKLLLVDDDEKVLSVVGTYLKRQGCIVYTARSIAEGDQLFDTEHPDVSIFDYDLPDGSGFELLKSVLAKDPDTAAIVLTGHGTIDLAVESIKLGAEHFLTKPIELKSLWVMIQRALEARSLRRKKVARDRQESRTRLDPFLGTSAVVKRLKELAEAVLDSHAPVFILGPTGSGKGVLARWLHENGPRSGEAFVDLNCAGLSKDLAESELFGHQRGSFTGAQASKPGLFEIAHNGTVFLDEIGDLDLSVQPKVLKALEDKTFRRVGDTRVRRADIRLVSATHRQVGDMVRDGTFRNDLLFRINTVTFELPALSERREDIGPIADCLLEQACRAQGRRPMTLGADARALLERYAWPGNIRELRNVLERATLFTKADTIGVDGLKFDRWLNPEQSSDVEQSLSEMERRHILNVLKSHQGHVENAANVLRVPRSSLYAKLKKYGIDVSEF